MRRFSRWTSIPTSRVNVRMLYMNILREARKFPSVKREGIVKEIREGRFIGRRFVVDVSYKNDRTFHQGFVRTGIWRIPRRFNFRLM